MGIHCPLCTPPCQVQEGRAGRGTVVQCMLSVTAFVFVVAGLPHLHASNQLVPGGVTSYSRRGRRAHLPICPLPCLAQEERTTAWGTATLGVLCSQRARCEVGEMPLRHVSSRPVRRRLHHSPPLPSLDPSMPDPTPRIRR